MNIYEVYYKDLNKIKNRLKSEEINYHNQKYLGFKINSENYIIMTIFKNRYRLIDIIDDELFMKKFSKKSYLEYDPFIKVKIGGWL